VQLAVQTSINEVYQVFVRGTLPTTQYKALQIIPDLATVSVPQQGTNPSPMFMVDANGAVERRTDFMNRQDFNWKTNWWSFTTLIQLQAAGWLSDIDVPEWIKKCGK
jgi:hypothetical protein